MNFNSKKFFLYCALLFPMAFSFSGCNESDKEPLKENAAIQAKENIQAQNQNIDEWTSKLIVDLEKRHRLINSIVGEFEGTLELKEKEFGVRIIFSSSIPSYLPDRDRTIDELTHELNNLGVNIHVLQWPGGSPYASVGCIFENVKPNYKNGLIDLFSKGCPSSYKLSIGDSENGPSYSSDLSTWIMTSQEDRVETVSGKFQSSTSALPVKFKAFMVGQ